MICCVFVIFHDLLCVDDFFVSMTFFVLMTFDVLMTFFVLMTFYVLRIFDKFPDFLWFLDSYGFMISCYFLSFSVFVILHDLICVDDLWCSWLFCVDELCWCWWPSMRWRSFTLWHWTGLVTNSNWIWNPISTVLFDQEGATILRKMHTSHRIPIPRTQSRRERSCLEIIVFSSSMLCTESHSESS